MAADGGVRSMADLHCHTSASFDSLSKPHSVVRAAAERGLTHLAITDHDRLEGALEARAAATDDIHVIVGQEVRTSAGDLIGLYLERPIPSGLPPHEAARLIRDQGGVVGVAHPFDRFRAGAGRKGWETELEQLVPLLDYVETWNARLMVGDGNSRAAAFAATNALSGTAVSDAHTVLEVGVAYTIADGPLDTADEFRAAMAGFSLVTARGSRLVRAAMPFAKLVQRMRGNGRIVPA